MTKRATKNRECIDCGLPCHPTLDAPLCDPCAALALTLLGATEAREALLRGRSPSPASTSPSPAPMETP